MPEARPRRDDVPPRRHLRRRARRRLRLTADPLRRHDRVGSATSDGQRGIRWSPMGHGHGHSSRAMSAGERRHRSATVDRGLRRRSPCSWSSRSSARSPPARSPCCPTPGTCSPTSSASAWRWPPSTSPSRGFARSHRTFGLYRLEILAALANAVLLLGVAVYVLVEAIRRFGDPADVLGGPMLVVAVAGLVANLVAFALLREGAEGVAQRRGRLPRGARRHRRLGRRDRRRRRASSSPTGTWVDPVVGIAIGLWIVPRAVRLAGQAMRILVQAAPPGTDTRRPARRPRRRRRRRRRPRPPRVDADVGHGRRLGAPHGARPPPTTTSVLDDGPRRAARALRRSATPRCKSSRRTTADCDEVGW